jgi:mRNA interferase RelE/StbE
MAYRIEIAPTALEALQRITDRRTRSAVVRRIDSLSEEPEKQGHALRADLSGLMSVRAAGQRYRVIYKVDESSVRVVVLVGIRREGSRQDVYALAQRLVERGLV